MPKLPSGKEYWEDNEERYYDEKKEAFEKHVKDELMHFMAATDVDDMTAERFAEYLPDFTFPDIDDWMGKEYAGIIGDLQDQAYEDKRDREMGIYDD